MTSNQIPPESIIQSVVDTYTKDLGESHQDKLSLQLLMMGDSNIITGMSRNMGWSANPNYTKKNYEAGEAFDVVFGFTLVVREHPILLRKLWQELSMQATMNKASHIDLNVIDKYYELLYGAAINRVKIWRDIAVEVWKGTYDVSQIEPTPDYYKFPKGGQPAITIFGEVITPDGTSSSLTLTEQASPAFALMRMKHQVKAWNAVGHIGHGVQFNPFGEQPYKEKNSYVPAEKKKRKNKDTPVLPPKKKDTEGSSNVIQAKYWANLADLPARSLFKLKVARVRFYMNEGVESLVLYGYRLGQDNSDIVETNQSVWTSRSEKGGTGAVEKFDKFKEGLKNAGFLPELDTNVDTNGALYISGMKLIGKAPNYTAYYRDLAVES